MPHRPRHVVAIVDPNPCTLAALYRAIPFAACRESLLVVAYLRPAPLGLASTWMPAAPIDHEELESAVFKSAARLLAPSCVSWAFHPLAAPAEVSATLHPTDNRSTILVRTSHRRGHAHLLRPRDRVARALARLPEQPATEVVECGNADRGLWVVR